MDVGPVEPFGQLDSDQEGEPVTNYSGRVRVKDYIPDPRYPDIPHRYLGYKVEVVSPANRRGEVIELALQSYESVFNPEWSIGDEFGLELP